MAASNDTWRHAASASSTSIAFAPKPRAGVLMTRRSASSLCLSSGVAAKRSKARASLISAR